MNADTSTHVGAQRLAKARVDWRLYIPKSITVLVQEGYRFSDFRADALAGLTVAIVALPLAMAIAIASGTTPDKGLITAVIAGFLISALGGSRFQIGGPMGAFIVVVAWNMSEHERFRYLMQGPVGDRIVLIATFGLTVLVDLTTAIEVGIVLAAIIFMHRMAEATAIDKGVSFVETDEDDLSRRATPYHEHRELPKGVVMFAFRGPLFFGAASRLNDAFDAAFPPPNAFILRFGAAPMIDVSGVGALMRFMKRCERHNTIVFVTELNERSQDLLQRMDVLALPNVRLMPSYEAALAMSGAPALGPAPVD